MIDDGMRQHIAAAIGRAEQGTRAEFVAAIARRADEYRSEALLAAMAVAILAGAAVWIFAPWPGPGETLIAELIAFIIVYAILTWSHLGVWLAPKASKRHIAARLARIVFLERGLASTDECCGVLIFVSQAERYIEIIADRGIDQAVEAGAWQEIVEAFAAAVKRGEIEQGFTGAIDSLGALLARHYPPDGVKTNRIPDRLVEL